MKTLRLALVYLLLNPYRYSYRSARRDGLAPAWARHLWWRDMAAAVRTLRHRLQEAQRDAGGAA